MSEIATVDLGFSVYGTPQVAYSVAQKDPVDYTLVALETAFHQVTAFESETVAYADVVEKRKVKLQRLGESLAILRKDSGRFKADAKSDKTVTDNDLDTVCKTFSAYGLSCPQGLGSSSVSKKAAALACQEVESEIDIENAEMDEVSTFLQGLMNKRDNAYTTATQLQRKTINTANTLIKGISI